MKTKRLLFFLIIIIFFPAQLLGEIEAGVSQLDITPHTGILMLGYGGRGVSTGVSDPLYVRVIVFRSGERCIAFVAYDLCRTFNQEILNNLRQRIRNQTGIKEVIFSATHTHAGPIIKDEDTMEKLPEHIKIICDKTITTVKDAYYSLKPVRIGTGFGKADLNFNRIKVHPDGSVKMIWSNYQKIPMGPVDQSVGVIKIDDLQGNTIAVLVNYACHPVVYSSYNRTYSADYPGVMCSEVQKQLKGNPLCIFFTGAAGDIDPYDAVVKDNPEIKVQEVGKALANEVVKVVEDIEAKPYTGDLSVLHEIKYFNTTIRWDKEKWSSLEEDEYIKEIIKSVENKWDKLKIPVSIVLITPEIGFIGLPGEFFVEFQQEIRSKSPVDFLFVSGYTNGNFGYVPTISAAVIGGYGANSSSTYVEVGTGEHLAIEAVVSLYKLLNRLKPIPASSKTGYKY